MVKIMFSSPPRYSGVRQASGAEQHSDIGAVGGDVDEGARGSSLFVDPSICTFWCAVAIGALVTGRPVESVRDVRVCTYQDGVDRVDRRNWANSSVA